MAALFTGMATLTYIYSSYTGYLHVVFVDVGS